MAGFWEQPNNIESYGSVANSAAGDNIAEEFDMDLLRSRAAWMSRNQEEQAYSGDIGDVNVLNYWQGGSMTFRNDWDPQVWNGTALVTEDGEGSEKYESRAVGNVSMRVLSDLDVFR